MCSSFFFFFFLIQLLPSSVTDTIADVAARDPYLNAWNELLVLADMAQLVSEHGKPFRTVFAPTSRAFLDLGENAMDQLKLEENRPILIELLQYHIADGILTPNQITRGAVIMMNGEDTYVSLDKQGTSTIQNDSSLRVMDQLASNGVLHDIDRVLIPQSLRNNSMFPKNITEYQYGSMNDPATAMITSRADRGAVGWTICWGKIVLVLELLLPSAFLLLD